MDIVVGGRIPHYYNRHLQEATTEILELGTAIKNNLYQVAMVIAEVEETECYKNDGFDTVHQWTAAAFGFKKTASYTLLHIGQEWTRYSDELHCYKSNLTPADASADFTTTQIEKMLPVGHDAAKEMVALGLVIPEMTVREISKAVKQYLEEERLANSDESIESEDIEEAQEEIGNFVRVIDAGWAEYLIPDDVLKEYATGRSAKGVIQLQ